MPFDMDVFVVAAFFCGLAVAMVTAPVGVSGAIFLLPMQVTVLGVPSPSVTPTNLLFNLVSIPGALARYRWDAPLSSPLTKLLIVGTLPGIIAGAALRVFVVPDEHIFKLFVAALLAPLGVWLVVRSWCPTGRSDQTRANWPGRRAIITLSMLVGVAGDWRGIPAQPDPRRTGHVYSCSSTGGASVHVHRVDRGRGDVRGFRDHHRRHHHRARVGPGNCLRTRWARGRLLWRTLQIIDSRAFPQNIPRRPCSPHRPHLHRRGSSLM